jgi:iron complex transport system substrate-binding protein
MDILKNYQFPQKIICLTEESVETLYLLGKEDLIAGVSAFVKRPIEATKLPKVSYFTSSNYKKILEKKPDLIIGHSDIQKDIAKDLIELGQNIFIANHRSINGILQYIHMLSRLVEEPRKGDELVSKLVSKINEAKEFTQTLHSKPKVYFEEWDDPLISGIQWVSELIELCGGENVHQHNSKGVLAKDRFTTHEEVIKANPDIIIGCWCGKKVNIPSIKSREGYAGINAIKYDRVFEVAPEIFLQPGPAPILDGIDILIKIFKEYNDEVNK